MNQHYAFVHYGFPDIPNVSNAGNVIQSLAAAAFLPRIDCMIPCLDIDNHLPGEYTKIIMNGYFFPHYYSDDYKVYMTEQIFKKWRNLEPLLVSMHLDNKILRERNIPKVRDSAAEFFKEFGPVGTRDESTLQVLEANEIPSYKSLCLTLTLQKRESCPNHGRILFGDISDRLADKFQKESQDEAIDIACLYKWYWDTPECTGEIMLGEYLLDMIQGARLVITSRLHIAAPALALGTPLLFIPDTGENGPRVGDMRTNARLSDYADLFNVAYTNQILSGEYKIDVNSPAPNPEKHIPYRQKMVETVRKFIGSECPYQPNGFRTSALDKMQGLIISNDLINTRNFLLTQQVKFLNRYRRNLLNRAFVQMWKVLGFREKSLERYYPLYHREHPSLVMKIARKTKHILHLPDFRKGAE